MYNTIVYVLPLYQPSLKFKLYFITQHVNHLMYNIIENWYIEVLWNND
jgi:hypothetical protein